MGGFLSSGGGGAATAYPPYLEGIHHNWLNISGADAIDHSITELMNDAWKFNPWVFASGYAGTAEKNSMDQAVESSRAYIRTLTGILQNLQSREYDPDEEINEVLGKLALDLDPIIRKLSDANDNLISLMNDLDPQMEWQEAIQLARAVIDTSVIDFNYLDDSVNSFARVHDDQISAVTLPQFQAGMRDINAVNSSAFILGQAVIDGFRNRDIAKYQSDLRLQMHSERNQMIMQSTELMLRHLYMKLELMQKMNDAIASGGQLLLRLGDLRAKLIALRQMDFDQWSEILRLATPMRQVQTDIEKFAADSARIKLISEVELRNQQHAIEEKENRWDLETYQYGANLIASVAGGTAPVQGTQPSAVQTVLGGALGGASVGGQISNNNPWGVGIGAVLGGLSGLIR